MSRQRLRDPFQTFEPTKEHRIIGFALWFIITKEAANKRLEEDALFIALLSRGVMPPYKKILLDILRKAEYMLRMIKSFACRDTEKLFNDRWIRRFQSFERQARKRLLVLHAAPSLEALMLNPGNRFHSLKGDRKGQLAISVNKQWRICFEWHDGNAYNVEIIDYH